MKLRLVDNNLYTNKQTNNKQTGKRKQDKTDQTNDGITIYKEYNTRLTEDDKSK